ncbi:MAG: hypothetical protein ACLP01_24440 [Solirubrobacteraceae bacterium]
MTDFSFNKPNGPTRDAFGVPLADPNRKRKQSSGGIRDSLKRVIDCVARTISGREKPSW